MAGEPQNLVLSLLREIRAEMAGDRVENRDQLAALSKEVSALNKDMGKKLESLRLAMHGESVLGRYAAAEVEDRLDSMEKRLAALEKKAGKPPSTPRKSST